MKTLPPRKMKRSAADFARAEEMLVEFIGGPFDGTKLDLHIVREAPTRIRVLELAYDRPEAMDRRAVVEEDA